MENLEQDKSSMVTDVILMSGGLDSVCLLNVLLALGKKPILMWFDYGQKNAVAEYKAVCQIANKYSLELRSLLVPSLYMYADSSILRTGYQCNVHKHTVENSELPARNMALIAAAVANCPQGVCEIHIGAHKTAAEYFDCTREFVEMANVLVANLTKGRVQLTADFINMTKEELVRHAVEMGMTKDDVDLSVSCYEGTGCGECPACKQRAEILKNIF